MNACNSGCVRSLLHFKDWCRIVSWVEPDLLLDLPGWCDNVFEDGKGTLTLPVHCVWAFQRTQHETQANQVWIFQEQDQLLGSSCLQGRCATQQGEPESCGQIFSTTDLHQDLSLFGCGGTLPIVYYWVCMYCTTSAQVIYKKKAPARRMSM